MAWKVSPSLKNTVIYTVLRKTKKPFLTHEEEQLVYEAVLYYVENLTPVTRTAVIKVADNKMNT